MGELLDGLDNKYKKPASRFSPDLARWHFDENFTIFQSSQQQFESVFGSFSLLGNCNAARRTDGVADVQWFGNNLVIEENDQVGERIGQLCDDRRTTDATCYKNKK